MRLEYGFQLSEILPYSVARTWHTQLGMPFTVSRGSFKRHSFMASWLPLAPLRNFSLKRGTLSFWERYMASANRLDYQLPFMR